MSALLAKKYAVVVPWTTELAADMPLGLHQIMARLMAFQQAKDAGWVVSRGGGWWRCGEQTVRGRAAAVDAAAEWMLRQQREGVR